LESWRSNKRRVVARIEPPVRQQARARDAAAEASEKRREELEFYAGMAHIVRLFAAPEDAGPGLAQALDMGAKAVAELGYDRPPRQPTVAQIEAALASRPARPSPAQIRLWQMFGRLWEGREPGRPPQTVAEAYAYAIARRCGGRFPHYRQDE
jgi:hypothetical protein